MAQTMKVLEIPRLPAPVAIDGRLQEEIYRTHAPERSFHLAAAPEVPVPPTEAWIFWQPESLVVAFRVTDPTPAAMTREHGSIAITGEDRVEFFVWNGDEDSAYACFEINAKGAIWDYSARFYRDFDRAWMAEGMKVAATATPSGYIVEAEVPAAALEPFGIHLEPGARFRGGLFRADYPALSATEPNWITWVEAGLPKPDFHVAASFGEFVLLPSAGGK